MTDLGESETETYEGKSEGEIVQLQVRIKKDGSNFSGRIKTAK